jgi:hypothetical protein
MCEKCVPKSRRLVLEGAKAEASAVRNMTKPLKKKLVKVRV